MSDFPYEVRGEPPNQDSIAATLDDYEILPELKFVPMDEFDAEFRTNFYAHDDRVRIDELKQAIEESGWISPLIAVYDDEGYYILEGGHRLVALYELGADAVPAMVVIDREKEE